MKQIRNSLLKLLILASLLVLFIGVIPSAYAAKDPQSGYCGGEGDGTNLAWTLDTEGLLTISGTGKMMDEEVNMPWDNYAWSIETIVIGDGVTTIGKCAFSGCYNLKIIHIADGVTSIGDNAFSGCSGLTSIIVDKENKYYDSRDNCNAIIETVSNTLIQGCKSSKIPAGVTSIGALFV